MINVFRGPTIILDKVDTIGDQSAIFCFECVGMHRLVVSFVGGFAENEHGCGRIFPLPVELAQRPYGPFTRMPFLHLAAMPNRFIARITVISDQGITAARKASAQKAGGGLIWIILSINLVAFISCPRTTCI